jgi:hypothetical protein
MSEKEKEIDFINKVESGLKLTYEKLIEFKKKNNSELVIMQGDKIVKIKPEHLKKLN